MDKSSMATALVAALVLGGCAAAPRSAQLGADRACVTHTGSRIDPSADCSAWNRSYDHDELARTGSTQAAEQLQLLDPSISVHR